jgi:hypothetical protein
MTTQSIFLRSLADHLDNHDVFGILVSWYPWMGERERPIQLQLTAAAIGEPDDPIPHLIAWAASLDVRTARLQNLDGRIYVHVDGQIDRWHVDVWDAIDERPELLDRSTIPVAELAAIAPQIRGGSPC